MTHHLTASQLKSLETTERIASCFSLIGTTFVISTFIYSSAFRKPINRLIFFASIGNSLCNCATMISQSGIRAGKNSPLCQLQGFMIQMYDPFTFFSEIIVISRPRLIPYFRFLPADALWNLAMAINVYLTLFRKHNSQQLKALEWKYQVLCVGMPFIIAMVFIFIDTQPRGKIYGPAVVSQVGQIFSQRKHSDLESFGVGLHPNGLRYGSRFAMVPRGQLAVLLACHRYCIDGFLGFASLWPSLYTSWLEGRYSKSAGSFVQFLVLYDSRRNLRTLLKPSRPQKSKSRVRSRQDYNMVESILQPILLQAAKRLQEKIMIATQ